VAHPRKQCLFVVLSLADLALTCWLLDAPGGHVYEANPLARWWLAALGWAGLACFKALAVALVLGLALLIARSRPQAAGRVLGLGCAVSAVVVLYSAALAHSDVLSLEKQGAQSARETNEALAESNRQVQQELQRRLDFWARLSEEVIAGRCTLRAASERVAAASESDRRWRLALTTPYPERPFQEQCAACTVIHAVGSLLDVGDPEGAWCLALRLEREFRLTYGTEPPMLHRRGLPGPAPEEGEDSWSAGPPGIALSRGPA
jgi:hypothetical protein